MASHDVIDDSGGGRAAASAKPFQIRGRYFTAVALRPEDARLDDAFYAALDAQLGQTPQFFANAPMILDMAAMADLPPGGALPWLIDNLRRRKLAPFGIQNATPAQSAAASAMGLITVAGGHDAPLTPPRDTPATAESAPAAKPVARTIDHPVRSGQTVVAEDGDLIVIGPVSSGAELIAAGNIHVYGTLRGRAMAGVYGDTSARIYCQKLDAELLAIAGLYRTSENLEHEVRNRNVQVYLRDERLCVETLG